LEIERRIVPDEKQVDSFIDHDGWRSPEGGRGTAPLYGQAGESAKEYYTEVPFDMELDGPYYSMLNFFDRVGKLERIVNVSGCWWARRRIPRLTRR
jgi:type IV pilus assembly protein PilO